MTKVAKDGTKMTLVVKRNGMMIRTFEPPVLFDSDTWYELMTKKTEQDYKDHIEALERALLEKDLRIEELEDSVRSLHRDIEELEIGRYR
jgi:hypothetical protein